MANDPKHVLVVEDEPNIAEPLAFLLEKVGYTVTIRSDGRQGLKAALEQMPDLILLDVMLPELDGFEVLRRLREDPRGKRIPVVILTARGQRGDRDAALDGGADMFIPKPFSNKDVVSGVRQLLGEQV